MSPQLSSFICHKFIQEDELKRLISNDFTGMSIQNLSDLFILDLSKLKLLAQHKNIDFVKLIKLREFYKELLLQNNQTCIPIKPIKIKCGLVGLDPILNEISSQSIIEVVGPTCTGKSRLVLSLAVESAINKNKVLYIDTDLSFSKNKVIQMIQNKCGNLLQCDIESICSSIQVFPIYTLENLINLMERILQDHNLSNSILILDSLTTILFANNYFKENKQDFYKKKSRIILEFCEILKLVTYRSNLVSIVTRLSDKIGSKGDLDSKMVISLKKNQITGNIIANVTDSFLNQNKNRLNDLMIDLNCSD